MLILLAVPQIAPLHPVSTATEPELGTPARPVFRVPFQTQQVRAHLCRTLVAQAPILLQRLVDDVFQLGWHIGIQPTVEVGVPSRMALKITPELSPRNGSVAVAIS